MRFGRLFDRSSKKTPRPGRRADRRGRDAAPAARAAGHVAGFQTLEERLALSINVDTLPISATGTSTGSTNFAWDVVIDDAATGGNVGGLGYGSGQDAYIRGSTNFMLLDDNPGFQSSTLLPGGTQYQNFPSGNNPSIGTFNTIFVSSGGRQQTQQNVSGTGTGKSTLTSGSGSIAATAGQPTLTIPANSIGNFIPGMSVSVTDTVGANPPVSVFNNALIQFVDAINNRLTLSANATATTAGTVQVSYDQGQICSIVQATAGSPVVTLTSTAGLRAGSEVDGPWTGGVGRIVIPAGTIIQSIDSATQVTLSQAATHTITLSQIAGDTQAGSNLITFANDPTPTFIVGMAVSGGGFSNAIVTNVDAVNKQITVNANAAATANGVTFSYLPFQQVTNCSTTSGSAVVTVTSTANLSVGSLVSGNGIPANAFIRNINAATQQITLSQQATATAANNLTIGVVRSTSIEVLNAVTRPSTGVYRYYLPYANPHKVTGTVYTNIGQFDYSAYAIPAGASRTLSIAGISGDWTTPAYTTPVSGGGTNTGTIGVDGYGNAYLEFRFYSNGTGNPAKDVGSIQIRNNPYNYTKVGTIPQTFTIAAGQNITSRLMVDFSVPGSTATIASPLSAPLGTVVNTNLFVDRYDEISFNSSTVNIKQQTTSAGGVHVGQALTGNNGGTFSPLYRQLMPFGALPTSQFNVDATMNSAVYYAIGIDGTPTSRGAMTITSKGALLGSGGGPTGVIDLFSNYADLRFLGQVNASSQNYFLRANGSVEQYEFTTYDPTNGSSTGTITGNVVTITGSQPKGGAVSLNTSLNTFRFDSGTAGDVPYDYDYAITNTGDLLVDAVASTSGTISLVAKAGGGEPGNLTLNGSAVQSMGDIFLKAAGTLSVAGNISTGNGQVTLDAQQLSLDSSLTTGGNRGVTLVSQSGGIGLASLVQAGGGVKQTVRAASDKAYTLAGLFAGATFDGVVLATGDRILLTRQATGSENGIYVVQAAGAPVRANDAKAATQLQPGFVVPVLAGSQRGTWTFRNDSVPVMGTTNLLFVPTSATRVYENVRFATTGAIASLSGVPAPVAITGTALANDPFVTVNSTAGLTLGMTVSGGTIPVGSTITAIDVANKKITLSKPDVAVLPAGSPLVCSPFDNARLVLGTANAGDPVVTVNTTAGLVVGMAVSGGTIPAGTTITAIDAPNSKITLSAADPAALANGVLTCVTTLVSGDRILVKNQVNAAENGIYVYDAANAWARGSDADSVAELTAGGCVYVREGAVNGTASFVLDNDVAQVGITPMTFAAFAPQAIRTTPWSPANVLTDAAVATTTNIPLKGLQTIDGIAVTAGTHVLVLHQNDATQNGVYLASAGAWTRTTDYYTPATLNPAAPAKSNLPRGTTVYVTSGTENAGTTWQFNDATRLRATTTAQNSLVTGLTSNASLAVGMLVTGAGIPSGTTIQSLGTDGTSIRLTANALLTGTNALTFVRTTAVTVDVDPIPFIPVGGTLDVTSATKIGPTTNGLGRLQGASGLFTAGTVTNANTSTITSLTNIGRLSATAPGAISVTNDLSSLEVESARTTLDGAVSFDARGTLAAISVYAASTGTARDVTLSSTFGDVVAESVTAFRGDVSVTASNGGIAFTKARFNAAIIDAGNGGSVKATADAIGAVILVDGKLRATATGSDAVLASNNGSLVFTANADVNVDDQLRITTPNSTPDVQSGAVTKAKKLSLTSQFGQLVKSYTGVTTTGSNMLTGVSSTVGLTVGMAVYGAGIPAGTTVTAIPTFAATIQANPANTITKAGHGLVNGGKVRFSNISAGTTGVAVATDYFVINATTNTFQVATAPNGQSVQLTTPGPDGTATVTSLSQVVLSSAATATTTTANPASLTFDGLLPPLGTYQTVELNRTDTGDIIFTSPSTLVVEGASTYDGSIMISAPDITVTTNAIVSRGTNSDVTLIASAGNATIDAKVTAVRDIVVSAAAAEIGGSLPTTAAGTFANGGTKVTLASTATLAVGMKVAGTAIPASTYIVSIDSGTQVTLSRATTAAGTGATLTFTSPTALLTAPRSLKLTAATAARAVVESAAVVSTTLSAAGAFLGVSAGKSLDLTGVTLAGGGTAAFSIGSAQSGDTAIGSIDVGSGTVVLTASGNVRGAAPDQTADLKAATATLVSSTGQIVLDTDLDTLTATVPQSGQLITINDVGASGLDLTSVGSGSAAIGVDVSVTSKGPLTATNVLTRGRVALKTTATGSDILVNSITAAGNVVDLQAQGSIKESSVDPSADITATTVQLLATDGSIGDPAAPLYLAASIATATATTAGQTVTLKNDTALAIGASDVRTMTLSVGGFVSQTGVVKADTLTVNAVNGSNVSLDTQNNQIGTFSASSLGGTGTRGTIAVKDVNAGLVLGAVTGGAVKVDVSAGNAAITQVAGTVIDATSLDVAGNGATGAVTLTNAGNKIGTFKAANAGGAVSLVDANAGLVLDSISGTTVTIDASPAAGTITQAIGAAIVATTLDVKGNGAAVTLANAGNQVGTFKAANAAGDVSLVDSQGGLVLDAITGGAVTISTLNAAGMITQAAGAAIVAATLDVTGNGLAITLTNTGNKVGTFKAANATGDVSLVDSDQGLVLDTIVGGKVTIDTSTGSGAITQATGAGIVAGTLLDVRGNGGAISLTAAAVPATGDTVNGSNLVRNLPSTAGLRPGMAVTGPGIPANTTVAKIDTATQIQISAAATATANGVALTFTPLNKIATFKAANGTGAVSLVESGTALVLDAITGGVVTINTAAAAGTITQAQGTSIDAATLAVTGNGQAVTLANAGNKIGTFKAANGTGGLTLVDSTLGLALDSITAGAVTITSTGTGAITQAVGGAIKAASLSLIGNGSGIILGNAGNVIGQFGATDVAGAARGTITLVNADAAVDTLSLSAITGGDISITSNGTIAVNGAVTAGVAGVKNDGNILLKSNSKNISLVQPLTADRDTITLDASAGLILQQPTGTITVDTVIWYATQMFFPTVVGGTFVEGPNLTAPGPLTIPYRQGNITIAGASTVDGDVNITADALTFTRLVQAGAVAGGPVRNVTLTAKTGDIAFTDQGRVVAGQGDAILSALAGKVTADNTAGYTTVSASGTLGLAVLNSTSVKTAVSALDATVGGTGSLVISEADAIMLAATKPLTTAVVGGVTVTAGGAITQNASVETGTLTVDTSAANADVSLNSPSNKIVAFKAAAGTGAVSLTDSDAGLDLGAIAAGSVQILSTGTQAITQSAAITTGGLSVTGSGAGIVLTNAGNAIDTFRGDNGTAGAITVFDAAGGLDLGDLVGGTIAITSTGNAAITQSGVIKANTLLDVTSANGLAIGLASADNQIVAFKVASLSGAGVRGAVALKDTTGGLDLGGITGASLTVVSTGSGAIVQQPGAVIDATTVTVTGNGAAVTLANPANRIGVFSADNSSAGAVSVADSDAGLDLGAIVGGTVTILSTGNGAITQSGVIKAATLLDVTSAQGLGINLGTQDNQIAAFAARSLSTASVRGNVSLKDTTGGLDLGNVSGDGFTLVSTGSGAIGQLPGATLDVSTLAVTGNGAAVTLLAAGNRIGGLAATNAGGAISVADSDAGLDLAAVTGDSVTIISTGAGPVTQSGAMSAAVLAITGGGGAITLGNAGNAIGTFSGTNGTGSILLADSAGGLAVGAIAAGDVTIGTTGSLVIGQNIASVGNVALTATGGTIGGTGKVSGNRLTLVSSGATLATAVAALDATISGSGVLSITEDDGLTIGSQAPVTTAAGSISVVAGGPVTIGQNVTAGGATSDVFIQGTAIAVNANVTAGRDVRLKAVPGPITGTGTIQSNTLSIDAVGDVSVSTPLVVNVLTVTGNGGAIAITSAANDVNVLSVSNPGGSFTFVDKDDLKLSGVKAASMTFTVGGDLTQDSAAISGGALSITASAGAVTLTNPANDVQSLTVVNPGRALAYTDATGFLVNGLSAASIVLSAGGDVLQAASDAAAVIAASLSVTDTAGVVTLQNGLNDVATLAIANGTRAVAYSDVSGFAVAGITGGAISLAANGAITQSAAITGSSLVVNDKGGSVTLDHAANDLASVSILAGTRAITYTDVSGFAVAGIAGGPISLKAGGDLTQTGAITGTALAVTNTTGGVNLSFAGNDVTSVSIANAGRAVAFTDASGFDVAGIAGAAVTLQAGGEVTQSAAAANAITAGTLVAKTTAGGIVLGNAANDVATLAVTTVGGPVGFTDKNAVAVAGIAGGAITLTAGGDVSQTAAITGSSLAVSTTAGVVNLPNVANDVAAVAVANAGRSVTFTDANGFAVAGIAGGTITLQATGDITQSAAITGTALVVTNNGGSVALGTVANEVASLAVVNAGRAVSYADATGFTIAGISGGAIALTAGGDVTQSAAITGTALSLTNGAGAVVLDSTGNSLANVGISNPGRTVTFTDATGVNVTGLSGGAVSLVVGGPVTQSAAIVADTLSLAATGGGATLTSPGNAVGLLAASLPTAGAALDLRNGTTLAISQVNAAGAVTIAAAGNLRIGPAATPTPLLQAGTTVNLAGVTGQVILENGGRIVAPGGVTLPAGQSIAIPVVGGDGGASLASAISQANTLQMPTSLLAAFGTVINLTQMLPTIQAPITFAGSGVTIVGSSGAPIGFQLLAGAARSTISGVTFQNFTTAAIVLNGVQNTLVSGVTISGCGVGLAATGNLAGTQVVGSTFTNNGIGARLTAAGNFAFGAIGAGNRLTGTTAGTGLLVSGKSAGTTVRANTFVGYGYGMQISAATGVAIGGTAAGAGNTVSSAAKAGVFASGVSTGSSVVRTAFTNTRTTYKVGGARGLRVVR